MRLGALSAPFFKTKQVDEKHRAWLCLGYGSNGLGLFNLEANGLCKAGKHK